ncbi:LysM peptidoglycan-binding domain-containing protein [Chitinophaga filiformis]|uniref:Ig-like domain-containing protein n=1 Tax=Chitinophaga filiformis TaxID=104663 RepID=UPI001F219F89|nr:Ig-like domain-containing protein [Chitinophaga filiformis]MCF6404889.1 LysM peptidoglycan-binding domain-containing protein [Chitinophaga filiformis]
MVSFQDIVAQLMQGADTVDGHTGDSIQEMLNLIKEEGELRFYVDDSPNYGHQAATVNIMKRIINTTSYTGNIVVYYAGEQATANKLAILLSGLDPLQINATVIKYGTCQNITFKPFPAPANTPQIKFGFTGGADFMTTNFADELKVNYFLRLQPYLWEMLRRFRVTSAVQTPGNVNKFNLSEASRPFNKLAYKFTSASVSSVLPDVWTWYSTSQSFDANLSTRTKNVKAVYDAYSVNPAAMSLWPVYGLHQFEQIAGEMSLNLTLSSLDVIRLLEKPLVILHFTDPSRADIFEYVDALSTDIDARDKKLTTLQKAISATYIPPGAAMQEYSSSNLQALINKLTEYVTPVIDNTITIELLKGYNNGSYIDISADIATKLANASGKQIFVISIGTVPQDVYNYFYANATLPGIFEGQGTSSLMISLGRPFMQVPKKGENDAANYPSILAAENYDTIAQGCKQWVLALRDLSFHSFLKTRGPLMPDVYLEQLDTIVASTLASINSTYSVSRYFTALGNYYQQDVHDKLMLGLVGTRAVIEGDAATVYAERLHVTAGTQEALTSQRRRNRFREHLTSFRNNGGSYAPELDIAEDEPGQLTLQQVYEQLTDTWSDGSINLLKALPKTYFSDFFAKVTGNIFSIAVPKENIVAEKNGDGAITKVTVTGATTLAFVNVKMNISLVYTAASGPVITQVTATADQVWTIDNIPWILFRNPGFSMKINEGGFPVGGGILGTIENNGTSVDLQIEYPVGENTWLLSAAFEDNYPGIASIYQAAGGVNLVQVLPTPLNQLAGFGLKEVQLMYNTTSLSFDYMSFQMTTNSPWTISQTPLLTIAPTIDVSIYDVADVSKRTTNFLATGSFTIGNGTITMVGGYPDFSLYGGLTDGTIQLSDLLALFGGQLELATSVTEFNYNYSPSQKYYEIDALLEPDKPLTVAGIFSIDNLSFNVNSNNSINTVFLGGQITVLPDSAKIVMAVSGRYATGAGWTFASKQTSGVVKIGDMLSYYIGNSWTPPEQYNYGIDGLSFTINTATSYWEFGAKTAGEWKIDFLGLTATGQAQIGYGKKTEDAAAGNYGTISADLKWNNINITAFYNFNPNYQAYGVTWGLLTGEVETKDVGGTPHQIATLKFKDTTTIGSLVETMVTWATGTAFGLAAPWNVLNSIPLNNLSLVYDFTVNKVSFEVNIGPINLGFVTIKGIMVSYDGTDSKNRQVIVTLDATAAWGEIPSWNAAKPETTPAPPGQGNKYIDLRMLALGQHVTLDCFKTAENVQAAIACMSTLKPPEPGKIPDVHFDANSSWLTGMDFGLLQLSGDKTNAVALAVATAEATQYFITMQIVFNDPNLYALRLALAGAPAKIFKGLDFQIMYKKISDSVGVYQAEIVLPDVMRKINMGQFNITLPVFGIAVFTNGDFQVDVGFPWKQDFSRSFTFQTLIWTPVGIPIPVMGSAGVYFGKLSSATTNRVPAATNGTFNPVLVFGFGMQFGFGYSFEAGILRAGFSLTAVAILEGILAKWNPYQITDGSGNNTQLETSYYFWFRGTVGIMGKLYGSVDFAIVKADVDVAISLLVQITFAPYEPIELSLTASVSVSLRITINLGLFKIKISFSFSARIQESVTIKAIGGTAPWTTNEQLQLLSAGVTVLQRRSRRLYYDQKELMAVRDALNPVWSNLQKAASPAPLTAYAGLGLTVAGDNATSVSQQLACYVAMLFIQSVPPPQDDKQNGQLKAYGAGNDTSFELLSKQIFRWAIAAIQSGPVTSEQVDAAVVTDLQLAALLDYLSDTANPTPITPEDVSAFMTNQFTLTVNAPESGETDATYFPVPPEMLLTLPDYTSAGYKGVSYEFGKYNSTSTSYTEYLRQYFNELAVQVEKEEDANNLKALIMDDAAGLSMASFIYSDYFLLICRQMLQSARESLKDFKYYLQDNQTVNDIVNWVNTKAGTNLYTVEALFTDNVSATLNADKKLRITSSTYIVQATDTFDSIAAQSIYYAGFTGKQLAAANQDTANTLSAGVTINYPQKEAYKTMAGQSLNDVAKAIGVSADDLINNGNITNLAGLLLPVATLAIPSFDSTTASGDTLNKIAAKYNITQQQLAAPAENGTITDLFDKTVTGYINIANLQQFQVGELISEIQATNGLQHLSGMTSRYYMAGLRLPTNGITPNYPGMWVTDNGGVLTLPAYAGLYSLTGQQFPLPDLGTDNFDIQLSKTSALTWLAFSGDNPDQLVLALAPDSYDAQQLSAVKAYATSNVLDIPLSSLGAQDAFITKAATYPFNSQINWNSASAFTMPYGGVNGGVPALSLWQLPDTLLQLPDPQTRLVNPRVKMQIGRYDEASRTMVNTPVTYYGYGSTVSFTIKKVPVVADSPNTLTTYEIMGADGSNVEVLEKMVSGVGNDNSLIATLTVAYGVDANGTTTQGIQTDALNSLTIGIAQVNLSTETRPDTSPGTISLTAEEQQAMVLLNEPTDFIRLLWQASITRGGGYYLYYYNSGSSSGLPDRIFNDNNEATLSLLVLYSAPQDEALQNNVTNYMNVLATGEAIDTSHAVLFAEANPYQRNLPSDSTQTLSDLAYNYYGNVADIVTDNQTLTLRTGKALLVDEGVYEVRPEGRAPGGNVDAIAAYFGTTADAIKAANPLQTSWPDVLPLYTALYLPVLTVTIGSSNGGTTFESIAAYYGEDLAALGGKNQAIAGLFADNQQIIIKGGPDIRTSTVAPGVAGIAAERPVPAAIPDNPTDQDYGMLFLFNTYNMLSYQVAENNYFSASNLGLPATPSADTEDQQTNDKMRYPKALTEGDMWSYTQSIPYSRFAKNVQQTAGAMPDQANSPYRGLGGLLQIDYAWQDLYGNRIITTLSQPSGNSQLNMPPMLTGYTDPLIGLNQWPSVAASWEVNTDNNAKPQLQLDLSFGDSYYQGLMWAKAAGATSITGWFTEPLDEASATDPLNYSLDQSISIKGITLGTDKQTVTIQVDNVPENLLVTLSINNISNTDKTQTYTGVAQFSYPDVPQEATSTIIEQAKKDMAVYEQLWYQLTDPNGIAYTVDTTLLQKGYTLTSTQVSDLVDDWISSIYLFLENRAKGLTDVASPAATHLLTFAIDTANLNQEQIFRLDLSFTIKRMKNAAAGDLETTGGILQAVTEVSPLSDTEGGNTHSLNTFAARFEAALLQAGKYQLRIATGTDREDAGNNKETWAVRLGLDKGNLTPVAYTINDPADPDMFAPRPISNKLESREQVPIYDYSPKTGIDFNTPSAYVDFTGIDMDQWGNQFFNSIDDVLSPEFTAAIQLVDNKKQTTYLQDLLANKEALADIVKEWMIPVFQDETANADAVKEAFKQSLLVKLGNAYATQAGIQFHATVSADAAENIAPRLYGSINRNFKFEGAAADDTDKTIVYLIFTNPPDETGANTSSNFTASDGLSVNSSAVDPLNNRRVILQLSGQAIPGSTQVTINTGFKDMTGNIVMPPLSQVVQTEINEGNNSDSITLTSTKLSLQPANAATLPFLISSPQIVRGSSNELLPYVDLDLSFAGSSIEHQISTLPNIEGYEASTWLSFVTPLSVNDSPLTRDLGKIQVPMPIREFPVAPSMVNQSGASTVPPDPSDISQLLNWNYSIAYSLPIHYPQDQLDFTINFNVADKAGDMLLGIEDAFAQLAEFITVSPSVYAVLEKQLTLVTAGTAADDPLLDTASIALASYTALVSQVVNVAKSNMLTMPQGNTRYTSTDVLPYTFYIQEGSATINDTQALIVSVHGLPPEGIGLPLVDIAGYQRQVYTDACTGDCCYYYTKDGQPLPAATGQVIQDRTVIIPAMNILARQDAATTAFIRRNVELVPGKQSSEPFIYTTGMVAFSNPYHPTTDCDLPVDISTINAPSGQHNYAPLNTQLTNLFNALLKENSQDTVSVLMSCQYTYPLNNSTASVGLPVIMQPIQSIQVKPDAGTGDKKLADMITDWTGSIGLWYKSRNPVSSNAALWFDLTIFSNLTEQPLPLVRLRSLNLGTQYITGM